MDVSTAEQTLVLQAQLSTLTTGDEDNTFCAFTMATYGIPCQIVELWLM